MVAKQATSQAVEPSQAILISVLTPCLDNSEALGETLRSIALQQPTQDLHGEVIVVDGSSTSHCRAAAEHHRQLLQHQGWQLRWMHQPARGVYDALNRALQDSYGHWIQILTAGDLYADPHSLQRLLQHAEQLACCRGSAPAAVFGQAWVEDPQGPMRWLTPDPRVRSITAWLQRMVPCHQALLFHGEWARSHPYPPCSTVFGDRPVMRAALAASGQEAYLATPVCRFRIGGLSSGLPDRQQLRQRLRDPALTPTEGRRERIKSLLRPLLPAGGYVRLMRWRAAWLGWRC